MSTTNPVQHPRSPKSGPTALSPASASLLVAEREIAAQIRSKSFLISTAITLVLIIGSIVLINMLGARDTTTKVTVVGDATSLIATQQSVEIVPTTDRAEAEQLLRDDEVEAIIVSDQSTVGYHIVGLRSIPDELVLQLSVSPRVELLETAETSTGVRMFVALAFGLVFMMAALSSGAMIMQNTVQEKQSRVVEILLAAVPARSLLAGKILGNSVIGVGSAAAMAASAALGLLITGQTELLDMLSTPLIWFVIFFIVGFVMVASVFAAGAALVSRQEDTGVVMTPAMMLIMGPYFGVVLFNDNALVMSILSYVPFSAPVAMPVRMFLGEAVWWEPVIALTLLIVSTILVTLVAARIYEGSLLRMGAPVSLRTALRGE